MAREANIPPFVIFHDVSLRDMARQRPSTVKLFGNIAGVGQKKLADYGAVFVDAIGSYCRDNKLDMDKPAASASVGPPQPGMLNKAKVAAFELFESGTSVEDVAVQIDRAVSTTSGYLSEYIRTKQITDPSPWIESSLAQKIRDAATEVGSLERLAPIKECLDDETGYEQIRVVIECLKVETGFISQ